MNYNYEGFFLNNKNQCLTTIGNSDKCKNAYKFVNYKGKILSADESKCLSGDELLHKFTLIEYNQDNADKCFNFGINSSNISQIEVNETKYTFSKIESNFNGYWVDSNNMCLDGRNLSTMCDQSTSFLNSNGIFSLDNEKYCLEHDILTETDNVIPFDKSKCYNYGKDVKIIENTPIKINNQTFKFVRRETEYSGFWKNVESLCLNFNNKLKECKDDYLFKFQKGKLISSDELFCLSQNPILQLI